MGLARIIANNTVKHPFHPPRASIPSVKLRYLRVFLRTFAIGLAAVWIVAGLKMASHDVNVKLPEASEDVLYTFPIERKYIGDLGSGGGSRASLTEQTDTLSDGTKAAVIKMILSRFPLDTSSNDDEKLFLEVPDSIIKLLPKKIHGHRVSNGSELPPSPWSSFNYFQDWKLKGNVLSVTSITHFSDGNSGGCNYQFDWTNNSKKLLSAKCFAAAS